MVCLDDVCDEVNFTYFIKINHIHIKFDRDNRLIKTLITVQTMSVPVIRQYRSKINDIR